MPEGETIIFEGQDIVVRGECEFPGRSLVITFTSRRMNPKPTRAGFGAEFFRKRGIPAIHIISLRNHWYQVPEMGEVLRALKNLELRRFYSRIVTYGSSMGAHAAMVFSGPLEADRVLAFSPQFALHGREAGWNAGWVKETQDLSELYRPEDHVSHSAAITVAADPLLHFDMLHLAAFRKLREVDLLPIPFGVHPPMRYLNDQRLLSPLVEAHVDGSFDGAAFRRRIRERRSDNLRYLLGLSHALRRRKRAADHLRALAHAIREIERRLRDKEAVPNAADVSALLRAGLDQGVVSAEAALEILGSLAGHYPEEPLFLRESSRVLSRCGRLEEATTFARRAVRLSRNDVDGRLNLAGILLLSGDIEKGTEAARSALGLKSRNLHPWNEFLSLHKGRIDPALMTEIRQKLAR